MVDVIRERKRESVNYYRELRMNQAEQFVSAVHVLSRANRLATLSFAFAFNNPDRSLPRLYKRSSHGVPCK